MTAPTSLTRDPLFPPLQKGGWGGFAFALSVRAEIPQQQKQQQQQKQNQKQIPRVRCAAAAPFCKGGNSRLPLAQERLQPCSQQEKQHAQQQSQLHMMIAPTSDARDLLFPPLQKGGWGGFAFALSGRAEISQQQQQQQKQKQIPRARCAVAAPFCKGGKSCLRRAWDGGR